MAVCCQSFYDDAHQASFIDDNGETCFYSDNVPVSKFGLEGYGVHRGCGSFGGKAGPDAHSVSILTRLSLDGYGARRAGSFAGKTPSGPGGPHPVGIVTRFGLEGYGVRRIVVNGFAGKTPDGGIVVEPPVTPPTGGWWPEPRYEPPKEPARPGKNKKRARRREEPEFTDPTAGLVPLSDAIVIEETAISASDASALRRAQARLNAAAAAQEKEEEEAILIALSLH